MRARGGSTGRRLATVLFIDMVQSTERAARLGDRRWREVLGRYHRTVRRSLRSAGGREVDNAGDGFFAAFDKPAQALAYACQITDELQAEGIEVRSGLHMGEVETGGGKLSGIAVHIGARVAAQAEAGQVLISGTLRDVLSGSDYGFDDLGTRALKGVPGEWRLFNVTWPEAHHSPLARTPRWRWLAAGTAAGAIVAAGAVVLVLTLTHGSSPPAKPALVAVAGTGRATLSRPTALALDSQGRLFIVEGNRVRRLNSDGSLTPIAGTGATGYTGDGGAATSATLNNPQAIALDSAGDLYIADTGNNVVRKVDPSGVISTFAASLHAPAGVAVGFGGTVLIADTGSNQVRAITPSGVNSVFAGTGDAGYEGDGSAATSGLLNGPSCLAVDPFDNVYIADTQNDRIRKVGIDRTINTVAGTNTVAYSGDGAPATNAALHLATGTFSGGNCLAVDSAGDLFVADALNERVREISIRSGLITTVAGNGQSGSGGLGGPAVDAELALPLGVAAEPAGRLYIAEADGNRVVRVG